MSIDRKIKMALFVLRDKGVTELLKRVAASVLSSIGRSSNPNECDLVQKWYLAHHRVGTMIDVGAHFGETVDGFVRASWRVYAFEPNSESRRVLGKLYKNYANLSIDPRAVSDKVATGVPFYTSEQSSGIAGLSAFHESHTLAGTIDTTTLAHVLEDVGLTRIDFLKIDTEGFDLFVLKGLPAHIVPEIIICEFEDRKTVPLGYRYTDLAAELLGRGYTVLMSEWYPIREYAGSHRWRRVTKGVEPLLDSTGWGNFIAVRDPSVAAELLRLFPRK